MPPSDDPWSSPDPGPPRDPAPGRGSWPFALAVVTALVLTAVVATTVVLGLRRGGTGAAPAPAVTTSRTTGTRVTTRASAAASATPAVRSASPTVAPATPTGTTSPTAAPAEPLPSGSTTPSTSADPDTTLKTNVFYGVDLERASSSCGLAVRRPKPPLADKKLQPYLTEVAACLTKVFGPSLAVRGFTLEQPTIKTYHRTVDSPCGDFDQHGSPAYYCSTTQTIYWPDTVDDGREAYTFARLGYVGLLAHEFGHHLQWTTGMLDAYGRAEAAAAADHLPQKERYALSRRLELQAQCFEGVFLHASRKELDVTAEDRDELRSWHSYTGDEDPPEGRKPDHGSSKAQYAWLERGLDSGDVGDCNTWTASAKSVT